MGSLELVPAFDAENTEYSATTTNATNTITATAADATSVIAIIVNGEEVENGTPATWETGENTVIISVQNDAETMTYEVIVTKE